MEGMIEYLLEDGPFYCVSGIDALYRCIYIFLNISYKNSESYSFYLISLNYFSVTDVKIITGD